MRIFSLLPTANCFKTVDICNPNSRVGAIITACIAERDASILDRIGNTKLKVLPLPVYNNIYIYKYMNFNKIKKI
jgi:hypothetical protein